MTSMDEAGLFAARMKRVMDAVELRQPDRVPTVFFSRFWLAREGGMTYREAMYDYDRVAEVTRRLLLELQPDLYAPPHQLILLGPIQDALDYKQQQWPGHGVDENASYQYLDREYMKPEEYDDYLLDPTGFFLSKYLPRIGGAFEGLEELPEFPALHYTRLMMAAGQFAGPGVSKAFAAMQKAGEASRRLMQHSVAFMQEAARMGFPPAHGAVSISPYDFFGDYLRGSRGIMLDLFRRRDKLLAAMDRAAVFITRQAIQIGKASPSKFVFIPCHWCFDGFMSPELFKTVYWPPFRKVLLAIIDAGLIPVPLWEGDCGSRLEVIGDIPRGKAVYWFERTDLVRAKEVLGDVVCLRGNVPSSLLTTGTPEEVDAYCRMLIEKVGRNGGFMLDGAIGIPDESKPENVRAMYASAWKYAA